MNLQVKRCAGPLICFILDEASTPEGPICIILCEFLQGFFSWLALLACFDYKKCGQVSQVSASQSPPGVFLKEQSDSGTRPQGMSLCGQVSSSGQHCPTPQQQDFIFSPTVVLMVGLLRHIGTIGPGQSRNSWSSCLSFPSSQVTSMHPIWLGNHSVLCSACPFLGAYLLSQVFMAFLSLSFSFCSHFQIIASLCVSLVLKHPTNTSDRFLSTSGILSQKSFVKSDGVAGHQAVCKQWLFLSQVSLLSPNQLTRAVMLATVCEGSGGCFQEGVIDS